LGELVKRVKQVGGEKEKQTGRDERGRMSDSGRGSEGETGRYPQTDYPEKISVKLVCLPED